MGTEIIVRPDWGPAAYSGDDGRNDGALPNLGGRWNFDNAGQVQSPAEKAEGAPPFSAEELALLDPLAALDEEDIAKYRKLLTDNFFSPPDLQRHYGLTDAEIEALQQPADDRPVAAGALERSDGEDLDPELRSEWEKQGGIAYHLGLAQRAVEAMVEGMVEAERSAFMRGFEALPAAAVNTVYQFLALEPGRASQPASDAQLETFAAHGEACAAVVKAWSAAAGRKYATAEARIDMILNAMSDADADATEAWFAALPPAQKAAVVNALAGA